MALLSTIGTALAGTGAAAAPTTAAGITAANAAAAAAATNSALGLASGATLAAADVAAAGSVAAVAGSIASPVVTGVAAQNQAQAQAKQARINAQLERQATDLRLTRERLRGRARLGALRASLASSGFQTSGSALDLISDEFIEQQLNEAIVLSSGGQAETRQRNIGRGIESRGRGDLVGQTLGGVTQGLVFANQIARQSGTGGGLLS